MHCQFAEHIMKFQANRMDNWETNINEHEAAWRESTNLCVKMFEILLSRLPTANLSTWRNLKMPFSDAVEKEESSEAAAVQLRRFAARKCHQEVALLKSIATHEVSIERLGVSWSTANPPSLARRIGEHYTPFLLLFQPHGCNSEHGQSMGSAVLGPWCCDSHQLSSAYLKLLELEHLQFPSHLPL